MPEALSSFAVFLSILWFLVYWILGGVFFAAIAILRLGRVRKVRFSCLFTLWVLVIGVGAAFKGLEFSRDSIVLCLKGSSTQAEVVTAVFGCGFAGVFGIFLLGALAVTIGGFLIFSISRTKSKPWLILQPDEISPVDDLPPAKGDIPPSKFF